MWRNVARGHVAELFSIIRTVVSQHTHKLNLLFFFWHSHIYNICQFMYSNTDLKPYQQTFITRPHALFSYPRLRKSLLKICFILFHFCQGPIPLFISKLKCNYSTSTNTFKLSLVNILRKYHSRLLRNSSPFPAATTACLIDSCVSPAIIHPGRLDCNIIGSATTSPFGLVSNPNCSINS